MKIRLGLVMLMLLVMFGLHLTCSQYAIEVEEIIEEREVLCIVREPLIH